MLGQLTQANRHAWIVQVADHGAPARVRGPAQDHPRGRRAGRPAVVLSGALAAAPPVMAQDRWAG